MKWPKIPYRSYSPTKDPNDRVVSFNPIPFIITEKLDGENISLYCDRLHARSEDSKDHPSRHWIKAFHANICYRIPIDIQIVGEYMYAKHSIYYDRLTTYYYVFAVIKDKMVLSWADTCNLTNELGLQTVPVLARSEDLTLAPMMNRPSSPYKLMGQQEIPNKSVFGDICEGLVIRSSLSFPVNNLDVYMSKIVRPNHVQTDEHWTQNWIPNKLIS